MPSTSPSILFHNSLLMIYDIYAWMVRVSDEGTDDRPIAPALPLEIISTIVEETIAIDDAAALFTLSLVSKLWMYECRRRFFKGFDTVSFHDVDGILRFMRIVSTPLCTFPNPIKCKRVEFLGEIKRERYYDFDFVSTAVQRAASALDVEKGALIQGTNRGIPYSLRGAFKEWWNIQELTISGGIHTLPVLFKFLGKLPHLQHLILSHIAIDDPSGEFPSVFYSFPKTLVKLSVFSSADTWSSFKYSVLPGGGMDSIENVQLQGSFNSSSEAPPSPNQDMLDCLNGMPNLRTFGLEPLCTRGSCYAGKVPRFDIPEGSKMEKLQLNLSWYQCAIAVKTLDVVVESHLPQLSIEAMEVCIADDSDFGIAKEEHKAQRLQKRFQSMIKRGKGSSERTKISIRECRAPADDWAQLF